MTEKEGIESTNPFWHSTRCCNICGEPLHAGCCNPGRPDQPTRTRHVFDVEGKALAEVCEALPVVHDEMSVFALTDAHVRELERAIRAEGYTILIDAECNITLERAPKCPHPDCPCDASAQREVDEAAGINYKAGEY